MKRCNSLIQQLLSESSKVVFSKEKEIKLSLSAFLSQSHLLIEDVPGLGKTTLAKTLSQVLGLHYSRIQFTNDLLPSDIIGVNFYNTHNASFTFKKGAIFCEFLLADEINRASSKTQSALLEAMEEKQVSVDAKTYKLEEPFFVIATQNPYEEVGTYKLPSSQLDRFALCISLGYPSVQAEKSILQNRQVNIDSLQSITKEDALYLQVKTQEVYVSDAIIKLVQEILTFTRESGLYSYGLSTRAALIMLKVARAWALLDARVFVTPEDILITLPYITHHRVLAKGEQKTPQEILNEILKNIHIDT